MRVRSLVASPRRLVVAVCVPLVVAAILLAASGWLLRSVLARGEPPGTTAEPAVDCPTLVARFAQSVVDDDADDGHWRRRVGADVVPEARSGAALMPRAELPAPPAGPPQVVATDAQVCSTRVTFADGQVWAVEAVLRDGRWLVDSWLPFEASPTPGGSPSHGPPGPSR